MKEGDKVIITNQFHAYRGRTGTISEIGSDDEGDFIFVGFISTEGRYAGLEVIDIMLEPSDIKVTK
jgi:hypothetical protein